MTAGTRGGVTVAVPGAPDVGAVVEDLVVRLAGGLDNIAADSDTTGTGGAVSATPGLALSSSVTFPWLQY